MEDNEEHGIVNSITVGAETNENVENETENNDSGQTIGLKSVQGYVSAIVSLYTYQAAGGGNKNPNPKRILSAYPSLYGRIAMKKD